MDTRMIIVIAVVALVLVVLAGWAYARNRRRERLREQFGPEYDRAVRQHGSGRAEDVLERRQERVGSLNIRRLPDPAVQRYSQHWMEVQRRFVDDPTAAVAEADDLVSDVMSARGYPMGEFEQMAADISVDHPKVVENYRTAHNIALRHQRGAANTEDLRRAMVHYRALFEDLLEQRSPERREVA